MKSLTLAVRTLREDQRQPVQWLLRSALVATFLVMVVVQYGSRSTVGAAGRDLFEALVWTNFWFLIVVGSALFSSVITEEKEQGTLGLLQLAGFGAPSILFGKSIGELTSAALLLAVQLPFAMLTVTLGGVSAHQVLAAFAQLGAFTIAVYGLALLSSVVCQGMTRATAMTAGLVACLTFGALLADSLLGFVSVPAGGTYATPPWLDRIAQASAARALSALTRTGVDQPLWTLPVAANLGAGVLAVLLAVLGFRWATSQRMQTVHRATWSWLVPGPRGRPGPLEEAIAWKEFHFGGLGRTAEWLRVFAIASVVASAWFSSARLELFGLLSLCFVLEAGVLAGRLCRKECDWNTLPALLTLPIPIATWIGAQVRGAARTLVPYYVAGFAMTALLMLESGGGLLLPVVLLAAVVFGGVVMFGLHLTMYLSLRLRRGAFVASVVACLAILLLSTTCMFRSWHPASVLWLLVVGPVLALTSITMRPAIVRRLRERGAGTPR